MFAAGLLLGFAMFAQTEPVPEIDNAFQNTIIVLQRLAQLSPQAKHYYEILSSFSDAIQSRREQLGQEKRKKSNQYVSQIFTADLHDSNPNFPTTYTTPSSGAGATNLHSNAGATTDLDGMAAFDFDASSFGTASDGLAAFTSNSDDVANDFLLSDNLYVHPLFLILHVSSADRCWQIY